MANITLVTPKFPSSIIDLLLDLGQSGNSAPVRRDVHLELGFKRFVTRRVWLIPQINALFEIAAEQIQFFCWEATVSICEHEVVNDFIFVRISYQFIHDFLVKDVQ